MVSKRFGRLTVVRYAPEVGKYHVECVCSCGNVFTTSQYNLIGGSTRSCGCLAQENRAASGARNAFDLTGRVFGMLTALERTSAPGECKTVKWRFRCVCGREKVLGGCYVTCGQIVSCGCAVGTIVRAASFRKRSRDYRNNRLACDPIFRLSFRFRAAVRKSLRRFVSQKLANWERCLGYTVDDLRLRLDSTMPVGYSWDDFYAGRLHIDHMRPLASFVFAGKDDPAFLEAWSLDNLQLLTAGDNMTKHDKWTGIC